MKSSTVRSLVLLLSFVLPLPLIAQKGDTDVKAGEGMRGESTTVHASDDTLFVPRSAFMYADNPRYTFFGNTPRYETDIQALPTIALGVGYASLAVSLHIIQTNAWWSGDRGSFHIVEDWETVNQVDKCGHMYSGYMMSSLLSNMLMDCGFSQEPAVLIGSGMGLAYQTYVEVEDGFAKHWGFSPSDAYANIAGAGFHVAQYYVPFLQNFTPRWSYVPAEWVGDRTINERPRTFIDDYNSATFWLAVNVNNLLPQSAESLWPDWLMLSVGYGIRNYGILDDTGAYLPLKSRFMIGLDYDWVKIIPESRIGIVNFLRQCLNNIRLPGPTLEFGPDGTQFRVLYPFKISVGF